jgi:hypothetical protein
MKAHPKWITACPLAAVDQRLADSHRFWHQAETAYFDPDGFRLAAQSAIQTLRSVTFNSSKKQARDRGIRTMVWGLAETPGHRRINAMDRRCPEPD